ncbi:MAG: pyridoxamine 5'-phosphate oxidase family protein [bacterium]|nr:pyridoxamine 5'-phosphate oxidase family protein [bacterium]
MAKRREKIRMTPEELEAFIEEQKSLQVATINQDGTPHLSTLWFGVVDGDIVFETYTKSQKIKNLERDGRIAVLMEDGLEYDKLRGVAINGYAELHTDPEVVHRYALAVMARNNPDVDREMLSEAAESMAQKRTAVVVKAEKTVSWDHTKLGGSY